MKSLSIAQAAEALGVSAAMVEDWCGKGLFHYLGQTEGGDLMLSAEEVLVVKSRMEEIEAKNASGDLMPPEVEDMSDLPLL